MKFLECVFHAGREVSLGKTASIACNASKWSEKSISRMWRSPRGCGGEAKGVEFTSYCSGSIIVINMFNLWNPKCLQRKI